MIRSMEGACLLMLAAVGCAADAALPRDSATITEVLRCREVERPDARLACFDAAASSLRGATAIGVDRNAPLAKAPSLSSTFGHRTPAETNGASAPTTLHTTIKSARRGTDGHWIIVLADGGVWRQVDADQVDIDPRPGTNVSIRRAALGSYFARLDNGHAVRLIPLN